MSVTLNLMVDLNDLISLKVRAIDKVTRHLILVICQGWSRSHLGLAWKFLPSLVPEIQIVVQAGVIDCCHLITPLLNLFQN